MILLEICSTASTNRIIISKIRLMKVFISKIRLMKIFKSEIRLISVGNGLVVYQRGRVSRVADTELILLIAHLIRPPGSIPGGG